MTKQIVNAREECPDYTSLSILVVQYGPDAYIEFDVWYDSSTTYICFNREETDVEYKNRLKQEALVEEMRKKKKAAEAERKKKKKEEEYKLYLSLKEKYEA